MISFLRHTATIVRPDYAQYLAITLERNRLFAGVLIVGFANGIVDRIADGFARGDVAELVLNTFEISAIVWVALIVAVVFLLRSERLAATPADSVVAAIAAAACMIPMTPLSWIALSGLAVYALRTSFPGSYAHRAAWIMLAIAVPMFWSRAAFAILSDPILKFDALLVGWVIGTEHIGNTIGFADGTGYLWIAPDCSSFMNVSLAVLGWVLFTQMFARERPLHHWWWCVLACAAVILINVTRLSLIGLYPEHGGVLHGMLGATVANWATLIAIVGICALGARHDLQTQR